MNQQIFFLPYIAKESLNWSNSSPTHVSYILFEHFFEILFSPEKTLHFLSNAKYLLFMYIHFIIFSVVFADFVKKINESKSKSAISPYQLRREVQRYAPRFVGDK